MSRYNIKTVFDSSSAQSVNHGLRNYMIKVYQFMSAALALSGIVAFGCAQSPTLIHFFNSGSTPLLLMLGTLGLVIYFSARIQKMSFQAARNTFFLFAFVMGISLSSVFLMYTKTSIARAFFVSSSTFLGMSIYGYSTKKDLTSMGSFMVMGLMGVIVASIINMFLKSSGLNFAISILTVIIFIGLTAYDTQKIKHLYLANENNSSIDSDMAMKIVLLGSLTLYMDFINLFLAMLRFFGTANSDS